MKTMKTISPEERAIEGHQQRVLKFSGQAFDGVHKPKRNKK